MNFFKELKNAKAQAEMDRLYLLASMEEAEAMDPNCEIYQNCKQEIESYMAWHKNATINDFYERYLSMHGHEENLNLMLPLTILVRINEERTAKALS